MNLDARQQYLEEIRPRYPKPLPDEKKQILDEFCDVCQYHRKYASRLLNTTKTTSPAFREES